MPTLWGDYHTHTYFSADGKSSIEDNILAAIKLGLKEIAITDHGFKHRYAGMRRHDFQLQLRQVQALRQKYPQIKILQSVEADIINFEGKLDIEKSDFEHLDFIMLGYHKSASNEKFLMWLKFSLFNAYLPFKPSKSKIEKNTKAYLNCIEKYPVSMLNHLNSGLKVDVKQIADMCKQKGIYIELNGKKISFTPEDAEAIILSDCNLLANSDAHIADRVGEISIPLQFINDFNIPISRIKNFDCLPKLIKP